MRWGVPALEWHGRPTTRRFQALSNVAVDFGLEATARPKGQRQPTPMALKHTDIDHDKLCRTGSETRLQTVPVLADRITEAACRRVLEAVELDGSTPDVG